MNWSGDEKRMKRKVYATTLIAFLMLLLINVGTTKASEPGYERFEYPTAVEPTIDGFWASADEWTDGEETMIGENVVFRSTFTLISEGDDLVVTSHSVIEILNDGTADAGDYWQICIDGLLDGGSAPQTDDFRIDIIGHTDLVVYQGTGTGWIPITPDPRDVIFADSISESPTSSTPHRILEISLLKDPGVIFMDMVWGVRVAVYDESNSAAGVQAWPPTDRDVPDGWGIENYNLDPYNPAGKVATPTFSPVAGTYSSAQSVSISCSTSGATIRYTTDGADPTSSSPIYTDPILVGSGSVTVKARAFKDGMTDSDIASATYTIQLPQVATPTFFLAPGFFPSAMSVYISCNTSGATIRYTLDGSTPTSSSTVYTDPISVTSGSVTIKARAFRSGWTDSDVATGTYTIVVRDCERVEYPTVVEPTIDGFWTSADEWTDGEETMIGENVAFRSTFNVTGLDPIGVTSYFVIEALNDVTYDAGDYWQICIDGALDGGSAPQTDDFRIDIVGHTDLVVYQGTGSGWTEVELDESEIEWANSLSDSPNNSTPHWVLEFQIPKNEGTVLMGIFWGIRVAVYDASNPNAGVQAWPPTDRDVPDGWGIETYTMNQYDPAGKVATPTFSPAAGTYSSAQSVTISCTTSDATIRYTLDGSTPTSSSPVYSSPISVSSGSVTVKARAFKDGMTESNFVSATYTIQPEQVATPTFSPAAGTYSSAQSVTISCSTSDATIRYTTNGADPTSSSPIYTDPISVSSGSVTVKARAFKDGMTDSDIASATYTIEPPEQVATPTFSPVAGTYSSAQFVTISCSTSDATIRYTTNGADPTSSSPIYTDPISVNSGSVTIKSRAFRTNWTDSDVASGTYSIVSTEPDQVATPTFSPAAGTYSSAQSVSIFCSTSGATICYTTDGADPTSSSTVYTGPISVSSGSVTIKARAFKSNMTDSDIASATYTIQPPEQVATPTFSPSPGTYSSAQSVSISCTTSDATIRYTLDGSTPTSTSTVYSSPISVSSGSVTIKAKAFRSDWTDSDVATGTYTINPTVISVEWIAVIISLCGLTAGAGGWLFRNYSARKRHKILFTKLMEDIDDVYTRFRMNTLRCETELYRYKNQVLEDFKQGLIDEEKYNILDKRIDSYLKEIEEEKAKERKS
jgi:hypothetical protein